MAWNGSNTVVSKSKVQGTKRTSHGKIYLFLLSLVLLLGMSVLCHFLFFHDEVPTLRSTSPVKSVKAIALTATTPAPHHKPVVTNKVEQVAKPKKHNRRAYRYWEQENTNGFTKAMQMKWLHVRTPKLAPVKLPEKKYPYDIFKHTSENVIACLLMTEPGQGFFGYPTYRGIEKDFLKSCETPIIIKPDDDEYTKNLKQAMIDTKIEIRERLRNGESLEKIIEETCDEANKLAEAKRFAESELWQMQRDKASPQDIKDYIDAANKYLGDKGIAPIHVGPIIKQKIKHLIQNKQEKQ